MRNLFGKLNTLNICLFMYLGLLMPSEQSTKTCFHVTFWTLNVANFTLLYTTILVAWIKNELTALLRIGQFCTSVHSYCRKQPITQKMHQKIYLV